MTKSPLEMALGLLVTFKKASSTGWQGSPGRGGTQENGRMWYREVGFQKLARRTGDRTPLCGRT